MIILLSRATKSVKPKKEAKISKPLSKEEIFELNLIRKLISETGMISKSERDQLSIVVAQFYLSKKSETYFVEAGNGVLRMPFPFNERDGISQFRHLCHYEPMPKSLQNSLPGDLVFKMRESEKIWHLKSNRNCCYHMLKFLLILLSNTKL